MVGFLRGSRESEVATGRVSVATQNFRPFRVPCVQVVAEGPAGPEASQVEMRALVDIAWFWATEQLCPSMARVSIIHQLSSTSSITYS